MAQKKTIYDLNGPDVEESLPTRSQTQLGARRSGGITSSLGAGAIWATTIPDVHYTGNVSLTGTSTGIDYSLNADGTMSEEVMHNYLDRVLQVTYLSDASNVFGPDYINIDPSRIDLSYNNYVSSINWDRIHPRPYDPANILYDQRYDHGKLLDRIVNSGAKFIWSMAGFWTGYNISNSDYTKGYFRWVLNTLNFDTAYIHHFDPEVICSADISESVIQITGIPIPDYIFADFHAEITILGGGDPIAGKAMVGNTFETSQMQLYPHELGYADSITLYGNFTRIQTQMWFYFLATNFISAGCEAIHFGDIFNIIQLDNGLKHLWSVMHKVRNYAKNYARRKFVILDAHTRVYSNGDPFQYGYYYDPHYPEIVPISQRQLVFDFHTGSIAMEHYIDAVCVDSAPVFGQSDQREFLAYGAGLTNNSLGGINPQGWLCSHNPAFIDFDNADNDTTILGCHAPFPTTGTPYFYGFESTSWFANQATDKKDLILKYNFYKIKCLDPYNHWAMPGRLITHIPQLISLRTTPPTVYFTGERKGTVYFDNVLFTNFDMIKNIWNNAYSCPIDWAIHNFSAENVVNENSKNAYKSLCLVGADKQFYITENGDIYGYVLNNGTYNGGTWLGVSPTYSSQIFFPGNPNGIPVKAKSDLIASPDGNSLLYIGVDGYIHGFIIEDLWRYYYFTMDRDVMMSQNITAYSSLIWPEQDKIYYIAKHTTTTYVHHEPHHVYIRYNTEYRIFGFLQNTSGGWVTINLSNSALTFGQNLLMQIQPAGGLTWVKNSTIGTLGFIYYIGVDGYLYSYQSLDLLTYVFEEGGLNSYLISKNLKIVGKLAAYTTNTEIRIYFVGHDIVSNTYYVYCYLHSGRFGSIINLAESARDNFGIPIDTQWQSHPDGEIAVSMDGKNIFYFASSYFLAWYKYIDSSRYEAGSVSMPINAQSSWIINGNSLQFNNNNELYYINQFKNCVYCCIFEESYCSSPFINEYSK